MVERTHEEALEDCQNQVTFDWHKSSGDMALSAPVYKCGTCGTFVPHLYLGQILIDFSDGPE